MVLNTELAANEFSATYIKAPQLDTLKAVCERVTSADTKFFVVLHSRYMWMINNAYFTKAYIDSIAASSKSMTETNWYTDVEPQLKKVKDKGIQVIVFGGDKSQINVSYPDTAKSFNATSIRDIHYFAARMENSFTENVNNCIVIDYVKNTRFTCRYVTLSDINKETPVAALPSKTSHTGNSAAQLTTRQLAGTRTVGFVSPAGEHGTLRIFSPGGALIHTISIVSGGTTNVPFDHAGLYLAVCRSDKSQRTYRFVVR
jgi:hypothetical protein